MLYVIHSLILPYFFATNWFKEFNKLSSFHAWPLLTNYKSRIHRTVLSYETSIRSAIRKCNMGCKQRSENSVRNPKDNIGEHGTFTTQQFSTKKPKKTKVLRLSSRSS